MLIVYIHDALNNLFENRKSAIVLVIFLVISFMGIIITDSIIFSVSKKAEAELTINNDNVVSISFQTSINQAKIEEKLKFIPYKLSFSQKKYFTVGDSPYTDQIASVIGVDDKKIKMWDISTTRPFEGNVVILTKEKYQDKKYTFIDGIPFIIIGKKENKKTDFLDSLGLINTSGEQGYIIPLKTMQRLTLENSIDNVDFIKDKEISSNDIYNIKDILNKNLISNYDIRSYFDAKDAVDNVLQRFNVLTNTIYMLLTLMALVIINIVSRRNFELRKTEFALKIIHGISINTITIIVAIEITIISLIGACLSLLLSYITLSILSIVLKTGILFRFQMISISLTIVIVASYISCIYSGRSFFKLNPVELIKKRMQ